MAIKSVDETGERVTRQPRTMNALEATYGTDDDKEVIEVLEDTETAETNADAAAEALAAQLKDKDDEIARARAETVEARRTAHEAGATVYNTAHRAVAEREANILGAIEARNQTIENATAALEAAMAANDAPAMAKAQRALSRAEAELVQLDRDKIAVENDKLTLKNTPPPRRQAEASGPTNESTRWIEKNGRYAVDPDYRARAINAHSAWVDMGKQAGTPEYIAYIDRNLEAFYGRKDHGSVEAMKDRTQPRSGARERPASSTAARADAGSDGGDTGGGNLTFKHAGGSVSLKRTSDGKETVGGKIPAAWVEAARWNGYKAGDRIPNSGGKKYKTDAEGAHAYAIEQLHILEEQRAGSSAGLQFGEGGVMQ